MQCVATRSKVSVASVSGWRADPAPGPGASFIESRDLVMARPVPEPEPGPRKNEWDCGEWKPSQRVQTTVSEIVRLLDKDTRYSLFWLHNINFKIFFEFSCMKCIIMDRIKLSMNFIGLCHPTSDDEDAQHTLWRSLGWNAQFSLASLTFRLHPDLCTAVLTKLCCY